MRAFKNKAFNKWASSEGIGDDALWNAALEILNGQVEADLGGCLYKKRLRRAGSGKSGGYRKGNSERIVFLYGLPKNKRATVTSREQAALSLAAEAFIDASEAQIRELAENGSIFELEAPNE